MSVGIDGRSRVTAWNSSQAVTEYGQLDEFAVQMASRKESQFLPSRPRRSARPRDSITSASAPR